VLVLNFEDGCSTTNIIKKIQKDSDNNNSNVCRMAVSGLREVVDGRVVSVFCSVYSQSFSQQAVDCFSADRPVPTANRRTNQFHLTASQSAALVYDRQGRRIMPAQPDSTVTLPAVTSPTAPPRFSPSTWIILIPSIDFIGSTDFSITAGRGLQKCQFKFEAGLFVGKHVDASFSARCASASARPFFALLPPVRRWRSLQFCRFFLGFARTVSSTALVSAS
jgi:hypothetical protein